MTFYSQENKIKQFKNKTHLLILLYFMNNLLSNVLLESMSTKAAFNIWEFFIQNAIAIFIAPLIILLFIFLMNIRIKNVPPHQFKVCNIGLNLLLILCLLIFIFNIYMVFRIL